MSLIHVCIFSLNTNCIEITLFMSLILIRSNQLASLSNNLDLIIISYHQDMSLISQKHLSVIVICNLCRKSRGIGSGCMGWLFLRRLWKVRKSAATRDFQFRPPRKHCILKQGGIIWLKDGRLLIIYKIHYNLVPQYLTFMDEILLATLLVLKTNIYLLDLSMIHVLLYINHLFQML